MKLGDFLKNYMCEKGIQEAAGVSIRFTDGRVINIHSDNHPALEESAAEVVSVTPKQSAQGGI